MEQPESVDICAVCGRRLLPGERAHRYVVPDGREVTVCELCKQRAEASGWLRPEQAAARPAQPPRRRRPRSSVLSGLRERLEGDGAATPDEEGAERARPRPSRPAEDEDEQRPTDRPALPRPTRSAAGPDVNEAIAAFNSSELRRTVAGISRSLGEPRATVIAIRTASGSNGARITVAWELAWYQWEVGPGRRRPEIRQIAKGETIHQLRAADRNWNLLVERDGSLTRTGGAAGGAEEKG